MWTPSASTRFALHEAQPDDVEGDADMDGEEGEGAVPALLWLVFSFPLLLLALLTSSFSFSFTTRAFRLVLVAQNLFFAAATSLTCRSESVNRRTEGIV
jgi:hypothetical protein